MTLIYTDSQFNAIKSQLMGACPYCCGTGVYKDNTCTCILEFRARHRLMLGGFADHLLLLDPTFIDKNIDLQHTKKYVDFYLTNPQRVRDDGMSLYIWSEHRGVGKTTLAHILAKQFVKYFSDERNYKRSNTYGFMEIGEFISYSKRNRNEFIIEYWDTTLFVLDDFGNEDRSAKWDHDYSCNLIQEFLRHRTRLRLPTIITSNTRPSTIKGLYREDISSLLEIQTDETLGGLLWREIFVEGRDLRLDKGLSPWKEIDSVKS